MKMESRTHLNSKVKRAQSSGSIPENDKLTSRRKFIAQFGKVVGTISATSLLAGNAIAVANSFHSTHQLENSDNKIFEQSSMDLLREICDVVIPRTETLGAADVNVHGFIDNQLFHCHSKKEQEKIVDLIKLINEVATKTDGKHFLLLNKSEKFTLMMELDLGLTRFNEEQGDDFKFLKELICFGYYTSEEGASKELRYDAIPGGFKGSVEYNDSDASWGSLGLFY